MQHTDEVEIDKTDTARHAYWQSGVLCGLVCVACGATHTVC